MKTILLLSHGKFLNNDLPKILGRSLFGLRVAHITTASKGARVDMTPYWETARLGLTKNGFQVEDLDIEGKTENELRAILKNFDAVFVNGGNAFYLLRAMRDSGFIKIIKELIPKGFIYMGASAGAYVVCPTIEVAAWDTSRNKFGLEDLSAFNLVPFLIKAHYQPDTAALIKEKSRQAKYPIRILTDEQAILIKDEQIEFLGDKEIIL
jgi:dipeptidase E